MTEELETHAQRFAGLSSSARRLLDYAAVLEEGARYAVLRHTARLAEPDMVADLREVVEAGILAAVPGQPDTYRFVDETARQLVLEEADKASIPIVRIGDILPVRDGRHVIAEDGREEPLEPKGWDHFTPDRVAP